MPILAIDTALRSCSLAILVDGAVRGKTAVSMASGHAEHLAPLAAALFAETGVDPRALARIGVVIGPGQFAGVRVGLAFARGLLIGTNARIVGLSSLEGLAASIGAHTEEFAAPAIDARRGEVYAALFDRDGRPIVEPFVAAPEAARARLFAEIAPARVALCGDGAALIDPDRMCRHSNVVDIDPAALARRASIAHPHSMPPAPLYLRPPDASAAAPSAFSARAAGREPS